jgi:pimeloyl-ACP methyl ester carboxylesterase
VSAFVLVHGSFHGGWCWRDLLPRLQAAGHRAVAPDLPGSGDDTAGRDRAHLDGYADAIAAVVRAEADRAGAPVVLVGHSMGGIVASAVAEREAARLAGLVYVNGLLLPRGQTLQSFLAAAAHLQVEDLVLKHMQVSADGTRATFPVEAAAPVFYHRCAPADAAWAASRLTPQATAVYAQPPPLTDAGFGRVRRFYVEGRDDRAVSPAYQRLMVQRTPCEHVYGLDTDHSPFLSAPQALADVLCDVAIRLGAGPAAA